MIQKTLKSYAVIAVGSLLFALAFDWFFAPNQVAIGGITGAAQVINVLIPSSLFSMAVSSAAIDLIALVWEFPPMDPMLATLCGGALLGLGLGLVFSQGATTGGTDIVARLLKLKFPWLPMGQLLLVPDGVVLAAAALAFGEVSAALYGAVALFVTARVMDTVLYGLDTCKTAYIISDNWRAIADVLLEQDRGVTILRGQGAYTGTDKQVLMVAFRQRDIVQLRRTVHSLDPQAFMIVCNAHEVLGEGFGDYQKED